MTYQRPRRVLAVAQPRAGSRPAQTVAAALGCVALLVAPFSAAGVAAQVSAAPTTYTARPFVDVDAAALLSLEETASQRTVAAGGLPAYIDFSDAREMPLGQLAEITPDNLEVLNADALGAADAALPADTGRYLAPVPGPITGPYGPRFHPILRYMRMHNGVDMTAACGVPVVAMANGTVTRAGAAGGYGNLVEIDHGTLDEDRVASRYAHLSVVGVRVGNHVQRGQVIGLAGTTGLSTGCHLHFEVLINGRFVDPAAVLAGAPHAQLVPMSQVVPLPSPTPTPSPTPSHTPTPEPSQTPSPSPDPSGTPSANPNGTPSPNPGGSPSPNPSGTPSPDPSGTPSPDPSGTPSPDPSGTPSPDPSGTPSPSPSSPSSPSPSTPSPSSPPEPSSSATPAATPSSTPTPKTVPTTASAPPATPEPTTTATQRTASASPPEPEPTAEG